MTQLSRKDKERLVHRGQILETAALLFAEKGFHNTTMQMVADASEWSIGTLYLHFKTKEALFTSILGESVDQYMRSLSLMINNQVHMDELIRRITEQQFKFFQNHIQFFQLFLSEQGKTLQTPQSDFHRVLSDRQKEHFDLLIYAFDRVLPADNIPSSKTIAIALTGAINSHLLHWFLNDKRDDLTIIQNELTSLIMRGVQQ